MTNLSIAISFYFDFDLYLFTVGIYVNITGAYYIIYVIINQRSPVSYNWPINYISIIQLIIILSLVLDAY